MKWAQALTDGYRDSFHEWGKPDFALIEEAEGERPHDQLVMAFDWIALEPMLS